MTGDVMIYGRTFREVWLWGVVGALAGLSPIPVLTGLWWLLPVPLVGGLFLVGSLALITRRGWGTGSPASARLWAALAWSVLVGLLVVVIVVIQFPPGSDLPEGPETASTIVIGLGLRLVGSGLLAAGLYQAARRRLIRSRTDTRSD